MRSLAIVCLAVLLSSCAEDLDWAVEGEHDVREQLILNGTTAPQITDLSAGQILAIGFVSESDGSPFCSGTLIDRDVALTAQHCVENVEVGDLRFGIGTPASPHALIEIKRLSQSGWEYDVALMQLDRDAVSAVSSLRPIPLNRIAPSDSLVGVLAEASGYHAISGVSVRRFGVLEVGSIGDTYIRTDSISNQGICNGDSGGPLFIETPSGEPSVHGTAIGGHISCQGEGYFSRVDILSGWIDDEMAWFRSSGSGTGGGSSIGTRRVPDVCTSLPTNVAPKLPLLVAFVAGLMIAVRRRR